MCFTETGAISTSVDGMKSTRLGVNRFVPTYPCSTYRTADGWVGVTALTPAQWAALTKLIGRPELAADPRFATAYERLMLGDEVDAVLAPLGLTGQVLRGPSSAPFIGAAIANPVDARLRAVMDPEGRFSPHALAATE